MEENKLLSRSKLIISEPLIQVHKNSANNY